MTEKQEIGQANRCHICGEYGKRIFSNKSMGDIIWDILNCLKWSENIEILVPNGWKCTK